MSPTERNSGGQAGDPPSSDGGAAGEVSGSGGGLAGAEGLAGTNALAGTGAGRALAPNCKALLDANPKVASGTALIDPDGAGGAEPFEVYCDMLTDFGGWTLLGSFSNTEFDAGNRGLVDNTCYAEPCINRAYSTVPIGADFRIDAADQPISSESWDFSLFSRNVHESLRGRTLMDVFQSNAPAFLQAAGATVTSAFQHGRTCDTGWGEFSSAACSSSAVFVFGDPSSCDDKLFFALGVAPNYTDLKSNCDGWPQNPGLNFPRDLRFWSR